MGSLRCLGTLGGTAGSSAGEGGGQLLPVSRGEAGSAVPGMQVVARPPLREVTLRVISVLSEKQEASGC